MHHGGVAQLARALGLIRRWVGGSNPSAPFYWLHLLGSGVRDVSPVQGMALTDLNLDLLPVQDLALLKGMPLTQVVAPPGLRLTTCSTCPGPALTRPISGQDRLHLDALTDQAAEHRLQLGHAGIQVEHDRHQDCFRPKARSWRVKPAARLAALWICFMGSRPGSAAALGGPQFRQTALSLVFCANLALAAYSQPSALRVEAGADVLQSLDTILCPPQGLLPVPRGGPLKLNGYEAPRRIRQQPWGFDMILVALTGWGQEEDRRSSQEAGFNFHVVKPVDLAALEQLLAQPIKSNLNLCPE